MILNEIAARTKQRVAERKQIKPLSQIRSEAEMFPADTGFPFETALGTEDISFICEIKRASPSKGIITADFPYLPIALEYEEAGAAAISVLTEPYWFQGNDRYLSEIARAVSVPLLRKDFTVDEYQIYEAKIIGASAVLLICALLNTETLKKYIQIADSLGLSALVEAHTAEEIRSALEAGARIIGVNNRDLTDFSADTGTGIRLRKLVPRELLFVSESGIETASDIALLREHDIHAVLIGEALMRSPDKKTRLAILKGELHAKD